MKTRVQNALDVRVAAAELAASRPAVTHISNGEETNYRLPPGTVGEGSPSHCANFTKGLPHNFATGLALNPIDYCLFVKGIETGNPLDFEKTPLGPARQDQLDGQGNLKGEPKCPTKQAITCETGPAAAHWKSTFGKKSPDTNKSPASVRAWESAGAGHVFDLEGPDAQAVSMPPAPRIDSAELSVEIAEVYLQALLRDTHFSDFRDPNLNRQLTTKPCCKSFATPKYACDILKKLGSDRADVEKTLFRGFAPGDDVGPYLSQFLLIGNVGINGKPNGKDRKIDAGELSYGALKIPQKVKVATPCIDYLTTWESWFDVQNGADFRGYESYLKKPDYRFITTPRDLATYVHYDALYEAYLNACLILLGSGAPLDPGIPYQKDDRYDKQQGFAHFGGPHILSLVCEVATRALKAVRYQKYNVHRRLRPEALAGRIHAQIMKDLDVPEIAGLVKRLKTTDLLDKVANHNAFRTPMGPHNKDASATCDSYLLPMAFPEGSPMHPSYGAGHATVAGACVTVLKAFFDHGHELGKVAYEANADGSALVPLTLNEPLTVEGELNKLAANISIGRDWAGVHYYSDYKESLLMGEKIALGILEEQKLCFPESFYMEVPLFGGGSVKI